MASWPPKSRRQAGGIGGYGLCRRSQPWLPKLQVRNGYGRDDDLYKEVVSQLQDLEGADRTRRPTLQSSRGPSGSIFPGACKSGPPAMRLSSWRNPEASCLVLTVSAGRGCSGPSRAVPRRRRLCRPALFARRRCWAGGAHAEKKKPRCAGPLRGGDVEPSGFHTQRVRQRFESAPLDCGHQDDANQDILDHMSASRRWRRHQAVISTSVFPPAPAPPARTNSRSAIRGPLFSGDLLSFLPKRLIKGANRGGTFVAAVVRCGRST